VSVDTRLLVLGLLVVLLAGIWGLAFLSKHFERVGAAVAPLEDVSLERFSVVVIGSGGTFENPTRRGPALLVGRGSDVALFDAGRGVADGLRAAGVPVQQIDRVFLTSLQPENTLGLDELWLQGWIAGRSEPLVVLGPPGTAAFADALRSAHAEGAAVEREAFGLAGESGELRARELIAGEELRLGVLRVEGVPLAPRPLPAFAYRVSDGDHTIALASATWDPDAVEKAAARVELLVTEAVYAASLDAAVQAGMDVASLQREATLHLRLEDVGALATRAGARGVLLARLRPPPAFHFQYERLVRRSFAGPVQVAEDGETVTP
jgi:ribonuclease Z